MLNRRLGSRRAAILRPMRLEVDVSEYYKSEDLDRFAEVGEDAPELWKKFSDWYAAVFAAGALGEREKALIALGVAHAVQCAYCIDAYSRTSLEKGANAEQMMEAVHVAAAIRGGSSLVHGVQMRNHVHRLSM
jgi:4-carboxymuconolactone decarboxylase